MSVAPVRIAVCGANHGRVHAQNVRRCPDATLVGVVSPHITPERRQWAARLEVPLFTSVAELFDRCDVDGIVIATPNQSHRALAEESAARMIPMLIEKPLAASLDDGQAIAQTVRRHGVPALVGHHRRFSAKVRRLKQLIDEGAIGGPLAAHVMTVLDKPDEYFWDGGGPSWRARRSAGGGPLLINAIHEVDTLRYLFGDWQRAAGFAGNRARGHEVEDTAVLSLQCRSGVLCTISVTDACPSLYSYERTAEENPRYVHYAADCAFFFGTHGTLTFPRFTRIHARTVRGWDQPLDIHAFDPVATAANDPLLEEMRHFVKVVHGDAAPLVTVDEALRNMEAVWSVSAPVGAEAAAPAVARP